MVISPQFCRQNQSQVLLRHPLSCPNVLTVFPTSINSFQDSAVSHLHIFWDSSRLNDMRKSNLFDFYSSIITLACTHLLSSFTYTDLLITFTNDLHCKQLSWWLPANILVKTHLNYSLMANDSESQHTTKALSFCFLCFLHLLLISILVYH